MKNKRFLPAIAAGLSLAVSLSLSASASNNNLAENAVSTDPTVAANAIASLRAEGPAGLDALLAAHAPLIQQHDKIGVAALSPKQQATWQRLQSALDAVSAQRDCSASHLYWYTNFDDAQAAAKASGKPILSLRLLGKLNEEYSCANSRFFRTTLYANAEVSSYLRDHFILHWQSVRPVPRITVDFGDGRKIERTITGNSIHYILDADGRVIDALPGLYGPKAFLKSLADAESAALKFASLSRESHDAQLAAMVSCGGLPPQKPGSDPNSFLREYHSQRLAAIQKSWRKDMIALGTGNSSQRVSNVSSPTALEAGNRAMSKFAVEMPMLKSLQTADDATWTRVAALHSDDAALDNASVALISSKNPTALQAARVAISKSIVENPLGSMLRNLQRSIAEDTVRNEYQLHSQIHEWFINGSAPEDCNQLNSLVYAKLFLTPDSDPWLGLVPPNTFTGLENNGLVQAKLAH